MSFIIGVLLGCMVGDILGAPIEGRSRQELKAMKSSNAADWKLRDFVSGIAMGTNEIRCVEMMDVECF